MQPAMNEYPSLYCSFLALTSAARVVFCMKNDRSMSLSPSSMILECMSVNISKKEGSELPRTYITGALMASTACHSGQFSGKMEKRVCKNGV